MSDSLINKVAESGLITLDLEQFFPKEEISTFDLKYFLYRELILKEKEFREALKQVDWSIYQHKTVAIFCSSDAILPMWAYMLISTYLIPYTTSIFYGNNEKVEYDLWIQNIKNMNATNYTNERVIIKGCGTKNVHADAYIEITKKLLPIVKSLMFGEACSTVPVFKRK